MKTTTFRYLFPIFFLVFLIACSTRRNTFLSRNSHALSTKYNILYNGNIALEKGKVDLKAPSVDNFWEMLPIERMQVSKEEMKPEDKRNPNFEKAEEKAIKAIQKHSMYIQGSEKNPQMDEAHLLLGKARYYDQRFVPAIEAFNYILYKYPESDKINEIKIWREKTNMRLSNDALAVKNLKKLLKEIEFKDQIYADANAALAQAYINLEQKDSAIVSLKKAKEFSKSNEEISRYNYILGQLYDEKGDIKNAVNSFQQVIDMKRKAGRQYVIHAHAKQADYFDFKKGDTIAFVEKFNRLLKDRENKPYLDVINHQLGLYYDKKHSDVQARKFYNASLKNKTADTYMMASNYRNLATSYFNAAKYVTAGKYYDSTLVQLKPRTREYNLIKKKRENLDDVIKYEGIAKQNDSILSLCRMSETERNNYFEKYIAKLKAEVKEKERKEKIAEQIKANEQISATIPNSSNQGAITPPTVGKNNASGEKSSFYFYNPSTVAYGKLQFSKMWGKRPLQDNWRFLTKAVSKIETDSLNQVKEENVLEEKKSKKETEVAKEFTTAFYTKGIPVSEKEIETISKERNYAYYQLGLIYKEKFKEYVLAVDKLENLLESNPEEKLVLPAMYNLYKLYEILDANKALAMKEKIISQFPDTRYAQILLNPSSDSSDVVDSPRKAYDKIYKLFLDGDTKTALTEVDKAIDVYTGEEIISKLELLKAHILGKLKGLEAYEKALNFVALNYPNSEEGKEAFSILDNKLSKLKALRLTKVESNSWKILFRTNNFEDETTKAIRAKFNKFISDRKLNLTVSQDIYTMTDNFVVIHGVNSESVAKDVVAILKDYKDYNIKETLYIISSENYAVVQIKKNFEDFLNNKFEVPAPVIQVDKEKENQEKPKGGINPPKGYDTNTEGGDNGEGKKENQINEMPPIPTRKAVPLQNSMEQFNPSKYKSSIPK